MLFQMVNKIKKFFHYMMLPMRQIIMNFHHKKLAHDYIKHNKKLFSDVNSNNRGGKKIVLCELTDMHSSHIAYSYLANTLATKSDAKIVGYWPRIIKTSKLLTIFNIKKFFRLNEFKIYESFGVYEFFQVNESKKFASKVQNISQDIFSKLAQLDEREKKIYFENLVVNGVWVGDLFYDSYLMEDEKPTIDFNDNRFAVFLSEALGLLFFWQEYFHKNDVKGVIASHCVYNLALPLRVAVARGIPAFQATCASVYRISRDNYFAYSDFHHYPEKFAQLSEFEKIAGKEEAKRRIERRFSGEVGVDMSYSKKSAFTAPTHQRLIKQSSRKKILIATHCFFDSPHSYGLNLFPDIYEWLHFLGEMTHRTDYDWYIKTHPDYRPGTMRVVQELVETFPRLNLLPSDASHHQIIAEGIDVALTVWGTIGFEYAALNMPVINCSRNNPHIAYDFNIHPSSIDEYENILLNLDTVSIKINKEDVYEYYFMNKIYNTENIFFNDWQLTMENLGGYSMQFTPNVYLNWVTEWTESRHESILNALGKFIDEEFAFRIDYRHFNI